MDIASATSTDGDLTGGVDATDVLDDVSQAEAELAKWRKQSEAIIRRAANITGRR